MRTSLCLSLMSYGGSYDFFRPFDKEIVSSECKKLNGRIYVNLKPRTYDCRVKKEIGEFLSTMSLTLSEEKTKVTHITEGFDFLGYRIIRSIGTRGKMVPKVLIPEKAINRFRTKV